MDTSYYLRDRRITKEKIEKLKGLEDDINEKIRKIYKEATKEVSKIMPIWDENLIEECRQPEIEYEVPYFYVQDIKDLEIGIRSSGKFRFLNTLMFDTKNYGFYSTEENEMNKFIEFYNANKNTYMIIDEYERQFTLEEFLEKIK